ncbi:MAG: formylglycine-generating enzyme family protein [Chloroflexi bacterium]|nr:formylglycine-generating enzyme family protein [Chloroflexota bacterium]
MKKIFLISILISIFVASCTSGTPTSSVSNVEPELAPTIETESQPEPDPTKAPVLEEAVLYQAGDTISHFDGTTLVYIPAGEFTMGVEKGEDNPKTAASTDEFWIYSTEVTNAQYAQCVATGECSLPDIANNPNYAETFFASHPVSGVSHTQAQAYCGWVNGRLPSEIEWEKTARGPESDIYPWGEAAPTCNEANFADCEEGRSTNVISHPDGRSFYDAYDMAGNVFEWVEDRYAADAYINGQATEGEERVLRGGSFASSTEELLAYQRFSAKAEESRNDLGFRCVVDEPDYFAPMCVQAPIQQGHSSQDFDLNCPVPDIKQTSQYCHNGKPYINIEINYTLGQFVDFDVSPYKGCTIIGEPGNTGFAKYACWGDQELVPVSLSISQDCVAGELNPTCGEGYEFDLQSQTCVYKGEGENKNSNQCPVGYAFDSETQCCSTAEKESYSVSCPPGYYLPQWNGEIMGSTCFTMIESHTSGIGYGSCTIKDKPDDGDGDGGGDECVPDATGGGCP